MSGIAVDSEKSQSRVADSRLYLPVKGIIMEKSPYSFGNSRKLSLYNCFMPFNLFIRFKCYNTV